MPIQQWSERIWLVTLGSETSLAEELVSVNTKATRTEPTPKLVFDLSGLEYVNSSHLSQFLVLRRLMIEKDSSMRLAAPTNAVWAVFLTTGLDKVFEFAPDVGTALASLQMEG